MTVDNCQSRRRPKRAVRAATESHHLHQRTLFAKMFIENRINKRNETDSCNMILIKESHREKLVIRIVCKETNLVKGFSVQVYG